jgi:hypothetical protein
MSTFCLIFIADCPKMGVLGQGISGDEKELNMTESHKPINRKYVSEIDRFLMEFDKKPEAHSESRRKEEAEYAHIYWLRDHTDSPDPVI